MSKKKTWRKAIDQASLQTSLEQNSKKIEVAARQSAIPDSSLFAVSKKAKLSLKKGSLKNQREALKKDRFKEKEQQSTSQYEVLFVKNLLATEKRRAAQPVAALRKSVQEEEEQAEIADLWADDTKKVGRNLVQFRNFSDRSRVKVKQVVLPLAGQSYNPSSKDHQEVIQKVVEEELKDVKELQR